MNMMPMTFEWGYQVTILFNGWETTTMFEYLIACVLVMGCGFAMQVCRSCVTGTHYGPEDKLAVTLMFGVLLSLSYILMLIMMTYNIGLFFSVIAGQMIGFYSTMNPADGLALSPSSHAGGCRSCELHGH